jgi:hypothetical protein
MGQNFAYDLTMALIPGAVAGYYAGLLIAKLSKFNSLKYEALRAVRGIDYMGDATNTQILKSNKVEDLHLIGSELFQLKHTNAGETVSRVSGETLNAIATCSMTSYSVETMKQNISSWQKQLRLMRVGWRFFLPWGQI